MVMSISMAGSQVTFLMDQIIHQQVQEYSTLAWTDKQLGGSIPEEWLAFTHLLQLNLSRNEITGTIPSSIGNLSRITSLQLGSNKLSGSIPVAICDLTTLQSLTLSNNLLKGTIPPEIQSLTQLRILSLHRNQLSGVIPISICRLPNLVELQLSRNQFTGIIPKQIGQLTSLTCLSLSQNQLSGPIPEEIGQIPNLSILDLSGNLFSGCIPFSILRLHSLSRLDVRDNLVFHQMDTESPLSPRPGLQRVKLRFPSVLSTILHLSRTIPAWTELLIAHPQDKQNGEQLETYCTADENLYAHYCHLPCDSLWRFWIPWGYLLMNVPFPQTLCEVQEDWRKIAQVQVEGTRKSIEIMRSILHLHEEEAQRFEDYIQTILPVLRRSYFLRHSRSLPDDNELPIDHEDQIIQNAIIPLTHNAQTKSIPGSLLLVRKHLKECLENKQCREKERPWLEQCCQWLPRVISVYWGGLETLDRVSLSLSQFKANDLRRKIALRFSDGIRMLEIVCEELADTLRSMASYLLERCAVAYDQCLRWLTSPPKEFTSGTWIHDPELGSRLLTDAAATQLLPLSDVNCGSVREYYNLEWHYLKDSLSPAHCSTRPFLHFMMDRLATLVVGEGTRSARVMKLTRGDRAVVAEVAMHAAGERLEWVLDHYPEMIAQINPRSISAMCLFSMITNPQDANPSHYLVQPRMKEADGTMQLNLVGLEYDVMYGDVIYQRPSHEFRSSVLDVLYLLPSMDQVIDSEIRQRIIRLSPELVLIEWLRLCHQYNAMYTAMRLSDIFTKSEFEGDPGVSGDKGLHLPIRVPELVITHVYTRFVQIQTSLVSNPSLTLHELMERVDPPLASWYQTKRLQTPDPLQAFAHLTKISLQRRLDQTFDESIPTDRQQAQPFLSKMISQSHRRDLQRCRQLRLYHVASELVYTIVMKYQRPELFLESGERLFNPWQAYSDTQIPIEETIERQIRDERLRTLLRELLQTLQLTSPNTPDRRT